MNHVAVALTTVVKSSGRGGGGSTRRLSLRHALSENLKINLKLAIGLASISIFLCVVKKTRSKKIGQNWENCDKLKSDAQFPSKHGTIHQIVLQYRRNLQNIEILPPHPRYL